MFEAILAFVEANVLLTVVYVCLVTATTFAVNNLAKRVAYWRIEREDYEDFDSLTTTFSTKME